MLKDFFVSPIFPASIDRQPLLPASKIRSRTVRVVRQFEKGLAGPDVQFGRFIQRLGISHQRMSLKRVFSKYRYLKQQIYLLLTHNITDLNIEPPCYENSNSYLLAKHRPANE